MFTQPIAAISPMNSWNRDYQTITYGNYGYGIYTQDVELYRNPYTGRVNVEREVDFTPIGNNYYQPITGIPASIHQHYIN
ncbi:unnamed protein product [Adineta steineri]|uniref:Uncharacterized protein n=1 Tax=Adineta steineri TaxID=433720 RepID=A0A814PIA8_9BILA|nr:unnamed protein product [Adineta steineri]CAF1105600.1 unnamed protein product [Adineta steineri]CAF3575592.1 unnamed protein product [Adineta steineri]CAF4056269.1 unnamed protein product [Adineta steineri]CAF4080265.1 unnamed protein product [Adineta steineri]